MRIEIKTKHRVKDADVKAVYLLREAIRISTSRMVEANLKFALKDFEFKRRELVK